MGDFSAPKQGVAELYELLLQDQQQLIIESNWFVKTLADLISSDKVNFAILGNIVSQLHIYHVARFKEAETWPDPICGKGEAISCSEEKHVVVIQQLKKCVEWYRV